MSKNTNTNAAPATINEQVLAKRKQPAPVAPPTITEPTDEPAVYTRTASDIAAAKSFLAAATTYDKATHAFAIAAATMKANGLHEREGCENFANWCAMEFQRANIKALSPRSCANLANEGALLIEHKNAPELAALSGTALSAIHKHREELENQIGNPLEVAAALPAYMKANGIGNEAQAIAHMATFGPEGDIRSPEQKKIDANIDALAAAVETGLRFARTAAKLQELIDALKNGFKAEEAERKKKARAKAKRSTSRRND